MDELTLLRKVREVDAPSRATLMRGRTALLDAIDNEDPGATSRPIVKSPWRRAYSFGIGTVVAAGIVAALVLTDVVGLAGWRGGADPAAADVLHQAAAAAIASEDPIVGRGQYLEIATVAVADAGSEFAPGKTASFAMSSEDQLFLPADLSDDWVWVRPASKVIQTYGPASEKAAAAYLASLDPGMADFTERLRAPGGRFYSSPPSFNPAEYKTLFQDPRRLLNYIYRVTLGAGPSPDGEALVWIADALRTGTVPAALRASFYEAAAMIPGVELVDGSAVLDGRTGVAIGRTEGSTGIRQEIIVDPESGLVIGERQVVVDGRQAKLPTGRILSSTAVTTSVVNAAPAGGTQNGYFDVMGCVTENGHSQCPVDSK